MSKDIEKSIARDMRRNGHTYSEILNYLKKHYGKVSKGSLSNWLRDITLTNSQMERIRQKEEEGKRKGREKILKQKGRKDV
jgi:hypothetical protein